MFPCREGFYIPMDPSNQFGQCGLISHLNELGDSLVNQLFNASIPIDRLPDLLRKKIPDIFFLQRPDGPMIEDGVFGCTNLNISQNALDFFPQG